VKILTKLSVVGVGTILSCVLFVQVAAADQPAAGRPNPKTVCEMVAGGTYISFWEGTLVGFVDAAGPRRITFGDMQPGQVMGKGRMLLSAAPIAGHASCRFGKEEGGNKKGGTSVCDAYAAQYIENITCVPVINNQGVFAFGSSATLGFTSEGGDAGNVTLSTSDNGKTLWAEVTVQKGQDTAGFWLLRLPPAPRGRALKFR
jgi:hypothetical protein